MLYTKDRLKLVDSFEGGLCIYLFIPSFFRLTPMSGKTIKLNFFKRIRFFQMLQIGYRVYLFCDENDSVLGSATFTNGGLRRYPFANREDLILGPYFVQQKFRGRGLASLFISRILEKHEKPKGSIYAHVWHETKAPLRVLDKLGFKKIDRYTVNLFHKLVKNEKGSLILFQKAD